MQNNVAPFFSIVIPTHNRFLELHRALWSLAHQSFKSFEVIIVDDNSDIDLSPLLTKFEMLDIRIEKSPGFRANAARNFGTQIAKGQYVAYLDSDDVFLPQKLEKIYKKIVEKGAKAVFSKLVVWRGDKNFTTRPDYFPSPTADVSEYYFVEDQRIQSSSICVETNLARTVSWDENLPKIQDPDFVIRLLQTNPIWETIDEPLAVLYDFPSHTRISGVSFFDEISKWLKADTNPLSETAKNAFQASVLPMELAKKSKLLASLKVLKTVQVSNLKLSIKALLCIFLSPKSFKNLGSHLKKNTTISNKDEIFDFIVANEERAKLDV